MTLRLQELQKRLEKEKLNFLVIESLPNLKYLTTFSGSAGILLVPRVGQATLLVDSRYTLMAKRQSPNTTIIEYENFFKDFLTVFAAKFRGKKIGFESRFLSHDRLLKYRRFGRGLEFVPTGNLVEEIRAVKDNEEVKTLKKALKIADLAFEEIKKVIQVGMTERQVAWKLEVIMRELGAEKSAWEPLIVATGINSALPHHGHSNSKIKKGDLVQLDYGCVVGGYHTDTSRVLFVGQPNKRQVEVYNRVLEAQELGLSLVKKGAIVGDIDHQVKEFLRGKTEGVYRHGLGHGVGLEIHEYPTLYTGVKQKLRLGEVITIEPGVYIEGWGGVRLEDMVLVTSNSVQVLTKATKDIYHNIIDP